MRLPYLPARDFSISLTLFFLYSNFEVTNLPLDKEKLDALLEEIKRLDDQKTKIKHTLAMQSFKAIDKTSPSMKKSHLLPTEIKVYFLISHYFRLTLLSINDAATALEIWIKAILPLLLQRH